VAPFGAKRGVEKYKVLHVNSTAVRSTEQNSMFLFYELESNYRFDDLILAGN
jgi:hypothetical protein